MVSDEEFARRYRAGETLSDLMEDFNGSYRALRNLLKAQNVEFREQKPQKRPAPPEMVKLYLSGMSIAKTGERFGYGKDATRRMLIDAKVQLRGPGRPPSF